jgi:uncharacterized membrane protein YkoI
MILMRSFFRIALIAAAISLVAISGAAQEQKITAADVPPAVLSAFKTAYPKAVIRGYSKETTDGKLCYEIESRDGTVHRDVSYNPDGSVTEIQETIDPEKLPSAAQQLIREKYPRALIMAAEKTTAGEKVAYEVSVRNGKERVTLEFDADGKEVLKLKK